MRKINDGKLYHVYIAEFGDSTIVCEDSDSERSQIVAPRPKKAEDHRGTDYEADTIIELEDR